MASGRGARKQPERRGEAILVSCSRHFLGGGGGITQSLKIVQTQKGAFAALCDTVSARRVERLLPAILSTHRPQLHLLGIQQRLVLLAQRPLEVTVALFLGILDDLQVFLVQLHLVPPFALLFGGRLRRCGRRGLLWWSGLRFLLLFPFLFGIFLRLCENISRPTVLHSVETARHG